MDRFDECIVVEYKSVYSIYKIQIIPERRAKTKFSPDKKTNRTAQHKYLKHETLRIVSIRFA